MIQRILVLLLFSAFFSVTTTPSLAQVTVVNERGINTAFQEYSPAFYQQGLIFIAANPAINKEKKEDTELGKSTTSIFFAKRGNDGNLQRPIAFAEELTTKFHDGPLSFNATGDVVFFTRTNLKKGKPRAGKDGKVKLKIYSAQLNATTSKWENIAELPFNNNDFDCMHPSVSADGQRLYFASNRPGGKGGLDLYVSLNQNGVWGEPANLGPSVNTASDEVTPFIHPDNTLYFATKGRKAVGGIDIFSTKKTQDGWLEPVAMPEPINTPSDDFGIIVSNDKKSGFFASNRASGQGDDDIFSFAGILSESQSMKMNASTDENVVQPHQEKEGTHAPIELDKTEATKTQKQEPLQADNEVDRATLEDPSERAIVLAPTNKVVNTNMLEVEISAFDKGSNKPIKEATVSVLNMKSIKNATFMTDATGKVTSLRAESGENIPLDILPSQEVVSDATGRITVSVNAGDRFLFNFSKAGYDSKYIVKTVMASDNKVAAFMTLSPKSAASKDRKSSVGAIETQPKPNVARSVKVEKKQEYKAEFEEKAPSFEMNEAAAASNSYMFELKTAYTRNNDATVSEQTQAELAPLVKMMKQDPKIEIDIAAHTDARGKAAFNLTLSQLRADNIKTFFVERGISPDRIRSLGYGETMLRNPCQRGVNCSESEHTFNVRVAIKVVKGVETKNVNDLDKAAQSAVKPLKATHTEGGNLLASNSPNNAVLVTPKKYYVVIGTFTKPENAQKHRKKAVDAGFVESEVIQYQETYVYGVSVRTVGSLKEATKLADYINKQKQFEATVKEWK